MLLGLKNSPSVLMQMMNTVTAGLQGSELFVYLDDIILFAATLEGHGKKFLRLSKRLGAVGISAQQETAFPSVNFDQSIINTSDQLHRRDLHKDSNKLSTEEKFIRKYDTNDAPNKSRGNVDASILSSLLH